MSREEEPCCARHAECRAGLVRANAPRNLLGREAPYVDLDAGREGQGKLIQVRRDLWQACIDA